MAGWHNPGELETIQRYLNLACDEAINAVQSKQGGPFGAVIVKDEKIIVQTHNMVFKTTDPTAHAKLGTHKLDGCVLYSSCEPCPMCFGACQWAGLDKVFYACSAADAQKWGFDDSKFYSIIADEKQRQNFAFFETIEGASRPFQLWKEKQGKATE